MYMDLTLTLIGAGMESDAGNRRTSLQSWLPQSKEFPSYVPSG